MEEKRKKPDAATVVKAVNAAVQVLAAGGVTGENAEAVAATGVDVLVTTWAYFGKPADIKMVVSA